MNEILEISTTEKIKSKIYEVRGKQVMLDSDLAKYMMSKQKELTKQLEIIQINFQKDFLGN